MSLNKSLFFVLLSLMATLGVSQVERVRYDNYRLYKASAENSAQLAMLKELEGSSDSIIFLNGVHKLGSDVEMVVAPHKVPDVLQLLGQAKIKYELRTKDLQKSMDDLDEQVDVKGRASKEYNWHNYAKLDDTYAWLKSLAKKYPQDVTVIKGGKTYEGRSILGVKISKSGKERPGIFVEAGIHAREWISPAAATFIINQLLTSKVDSIRQLANNYNWFIFPHVNPDGYAFTQTDRMWRKTRKPHGACIGTDPNRNWNFHWNEIGSSAYPCHDTYAGPSAFSEIEVLSLSNYIASIKHKIQLYISLHSFGQIVMYPYGFTDQLPDNAKDLEQVMNVSVAAIAKRYNTKYIGGSIAERLPYASGSSIDWAYGTQGIRMAFVFELRPQSGSFSRFVLSPKQIIPTSQELLDALIPMTAEVQKLGYFNI